MFNWLKQVFAPSATTGSTFSRLSLDLHSHLLPGIDDGAPDLETSLRLIQGLKDLGYTSIITTPHVFSDYYPNTRELILRKRDEVQQALHREGIDIAFDAAAEYFVDEYFEKLLQQEAPLTIGGKYVLIEQSTLSASPNLHQVVFQLRSKGYEVILAHPERYIYYRDRLEEYRQLKDIGCHLQGNLLSLTGYYGKPVQSIIRYLHKNDLIDFWGTDLHHERHLERLQRMAGDPSFSTYFEHPSIHNAGLARERV